MPTPVLAPADVLLADGSLAVLRPLTADDGAALHDLHERVSDEAIRLRFFAPSRYAAHQYVDHVLADPDVLCLVAEVHGRLVAVATAEPLRSGACEVAFLVADDHHRQGLATLLLEHLAALAKAHGVTHFEAGVLFENGPMLTVFVDAGFRLSRTPDCDTVVIDLQTAADEATLTRADAREIQADARSLAPLLHPGSVAVVGARSDGTGIGAAVLRAIVAGGFQGTVSAVHPRLRELSGVAAFARLQDVPGPVDLVVVCVPAAGVLEVLRGAAAARARAAVIVSAGFGELGEAGAVLQHELATFARAHDLRVVGPNCLGLLLNAPNLRLNATFNDVLPPIGGLAVASQSGGVGVILMDFARELGLGVHTFVSLGNKADVSSNDLLAAWYLDPEVTQAALYLESFGNAAKFARFARRFAERKPLLAVVGGRSVGGSRAGASHTAAGATSAVGVDALFAQAGVIRCSDAEDLARTALFLSEQPLPRGRRLAVLSNAGGMGVLAADAAAAVGLDVVEFSVTLQQRISALVNDGPGTSNPVDAGAAAVPAQFAALVEAVLASGEVDTALVIPVATGVTDFGGTLAELRRVRAGHPELPVVMVPLGGGTYSDGLALPRLTRYRSAASAVQAVARAVGYAEWLAAPRTAVAASDPDLVVAARQRVGALLAEAPDGRWLGPGEIPELLSDYGLAPTGAVATGVDHAVDTASATGFPVAVKVAEPDVVHKSDRGLVRVGLHTEAEVRWAVEDFERELGHAPTVLVQPVGSGVEVALGVVRDPALGPLVMVAAGGVITDVLDDRVFLVPPLSPSDAARAVRSLRIWKLLDGFRGSVKVDVAGLERLILAVGRLAVDVAEVAELDLNPVLVGPDGCAVVDVRLRLEPMSRSDLRAPRQLRPVH